MATLFSDNFDRADSTTLGGNWVENYGDWRIASNKLTSTAAGDNICSNTTALGTAAYQVEAVIGYTPASDGGPGICGRLVDINNFYLLHLPPSGVARTNLYKKVSGGWTLLGTGTIVLVGGETFKLSMNGTAIKVYVNGVEDISATDSAFGSEGHPGSRIYNGSSSSQTLDNYAVYDFAAAGGGPTFRRALLGVGP
ncbi:MAG: hypothetical protein QG671_3497 [Actinomycetota bacterium]|nr:hypothetical protein [Actinomycetota bacterium]